MMQPSPLPNVFVVDTPHQLLNALEAVHSLRLKNNHLLVTRPKGSGIQDRFTPLIKAGDWVTVSFPSVWIKPRYRLQKLLGPVANRWYCRCLHFLQMLALAKVASRFRQVDALFLGHYSAEWTPFMRHIANTVQFNTLYLLDDGTDTLKINHQRRKAARNDCDVAMTRYGPRSSPWKAIESRFRERYWNWKLAESPNVTFFTAYDIDVREGDRIIRNTYTYLQSMAPSTATNLQDTVILIGICSTDNYIDMEEHLIFLSKIREHFADKKIMYVAHPRDSVAHVAQIREHLRCELWPSSSVIEYDLIVKGIKPAAIAALPSSALITLAQSMDADVELVCFYIAPEHWIHWGEEAEGAYRYIKSKVQQRVTTVPLCLREHQCSAHQGLRLSSYDPAVSETCKQVGSES